MDTTRLKKFAQFARQTLIKQIESKLNSVTATGAMVQREKPREFRKLKEAVARHGESGVVDQVAYIWFNRFVALRFLDIHKLNVIGVVSPVPGEVLPEILVDAKAGHIDEDLVEAKAARRQVQLLLDGETPSNDPHSEAYRVLLVAVCNYWHRVMPFLFEKIDDYAELLLPDDLLSINSILAYVREAMTPDISQDVEIIGWLYQFYISEKKDEVFAALKKNKKIAAEDIPAATQLFTPLWIVRYLVENSLGRIWLLNRPDSQLAQHMDFYIAPEAPEADFPCFSTPEEIRICDPAAGSGHMLTYAFDLLYTIYEEEGYDRTEIPKLILKHNLTGLEIDDRAGAMAAFALSMKAAMKLGRRQFLQMQERPDICVFQNPNFNETEVTEVARMLGSDLFNDEFVAMCTQFRQAKNFGSLIVPTFHQAGNALRVVESLDYFSDGILQEIQSRLIALLRVAAALTSRYHVVLANPPYMGQGSMNAELRNFSKRFFPDSKADLYSMFMERGLNLLQVNGKMAMVNMQSWMFLSAFDKLRAKLQSTTCLHSMAHFGPRAFDSISGEVVATTGFVFGKFVSTTQRGTYLRLVDGKNEAEKAALAIDAKNNPQSEIRHTTSIAEISKLPGKPIAYWLTNKFRSVFDSEYVVENLAERVTEGVKTGDNNRFLRFWFEVSAANEGWKRYDKAGESRRWFGSAMHVIDWRKNGIILLEFEGAGLGALKFFGKPHFVWSGISTGPPTFRYSEPEIWFDATSPSVVGAKNSNALLAYLNCKVAAKVLMTLNPTIHFNIGDVKKAPVPNLSTKHADIASECIDLARSDWDAFETSWDFTTPALLSPHHRAETLKASYAQARTHWQIVTDRMQELEEANNRTFIDLYGLQDELAADVPIEDITLNCNPAYRYRHRSTYTAEDQERLLRADTMAEFLSFAVGCMFGRYSLDEPGLILADAGGTLADYTARIPEPSFMPDADNVIPVLQSDWFPDDITERFRHFLRAAFGEAHFSENLKFIEVALGKNIRRYFTKDFYAAHVQRYKKRPIYWMISSPKETFNALIYIHRYRADTMSVVLNNYLREFISKLEAERERLEKLSDDSTVAQAARIKALQDASKVTQQLSELKEWEREVILPLAQQKIEIDLNDGVKQNYPQLGAALKKIAGLN